MAKKRKKTKTYKKRSRMGAASFGPKTGVNAGDMWALAGGVIAGAIGKKFLDTTLAKQETLKIDQKTLDAAGVAAGVVGLIYLEGAFLQGLSIGVGSASAISGLQELKVLKGVGLPPLVPFRPRPKERSVSGGNTKTSRVGGAQNAYGYPQTPGVGGGRRMNRTSFMSEGIDNGN